MEKKALVVSLATRYGFDRLTVEKVPVLRWKYDHAKAHNIKF